MGAGQGSAGGSRDCGVHSGKRGATFVLDLHSKKKIHNTLLQQMRDSLFVCVCTGSSD